MSDIVERLRNWRTVHLARLHLLMEEAADEIERLSRTGSDLRQSCDNATECGDQIEKLPERDRRPTLTRGERLAIELAVEDYTLNNDDDECCGTAAALRGLLERLGGER